MLDLTVNIATKLNRTHLLTGKAAWVLPCLGRTEIDVQAGGRQSVTVEDSMSMKLGVGAFSVTTTWYLPGAVIDSTALSVGLAPARP